LSHEAYTGDWYASVVPTWHDEDAGFKAANIARIVKTNGLTPCRIADIGCGTGGILKALLDDCAFGSATSVGYDIAPYAIKLAERYQSDRLHFHCADFLETDEHHDLLLCIDVFEHVSDYMAFLRKLRGRSRHYVFHIPLDLSVLGVLRGYHHYTRAVGHLHHFDRTTALRTLQDTGFTVADVQYTRISEGALRIHPEWRTPMARLGIAGRWFLRSLVGEHASVRLLGGASLLVLACDQTSGSPPTVNEEGRENRRCRTWGT
jgi:SAM-dependent methyltransferase